MGQRRDLLNYVAGSENDFEWYPTTNEIIEELHYHIVKISQANYPTGSFLDIGAGDGKVITTLKKYSKTKEETKRFTISDSYAIEKSKPLLNSLDSDVFVIGTDFFESTLVDKKVNVIFSNPPYSIFEKWTEKIIKEANTDSIYLVIPERWSKSKIIENALEYRDAEAEVIGSYSFEDSEDRKARANVDLIYISLKKHSQKNPFDDWFNSYYDFENLDLSKIEKPIDIKEKIENELVSGNSLIQRLENLYLEEMDKLNKNYSNLAALDSNLLKELDVNVEKLINSFKLKIKGIKNIYWTELFDNLDTITSKLTRTSRRLLLETLTKNTNVDFTVNNAYAIVIWAIKNSNKYYNQQLLSVYKGLTVFESIVKYKSNQRIILDDWRYLNDEASHYALDYRIIKSMPYAIVSNEQYHVSTSGNNLAIDCSYFISDIITIANNLSFVVDGNPMNREWFSGKAQIFYINSKRTEPLKKGQKTNLGKIQEVFKLDPKYNQGKYQYKIDGQYVHEDSVKINEDIFMEVKAFKNGNLWFKFNQRFIKALNIEAARLNGWIKSAKEASQEFDVTEEEANELFKSNFMITSSNQQNLLGFIK